MLEQDAVAERAVAREPAPAEPGASAPDGRWPARLALAAALGSVLAAAGAVAVHVVAVRAGRPTEPLLASDLTVAVVFPITGYLLLRREPRNRCGWVLSSCALIGVSALAHQWAQDAGVAREGAALADLATWLSAWTYWPYFAQPTLLPVLFPSGRAPSARWRRYVQAVLVVLALGAVASMLKPDPDVEGLGLANPLGIGSAAHLAPWIAVQAGGVGVLSLIATPIALGGLALRQRRSTGRERAQLQWLLLGFTTCLALGVGSALGGGEPLFAAAFAAIPVAILVAVLRHGLFDVEVVVNRTIVYAVLTGAGLLAYVGLAAAISRYAGADGYGPALAALVVAMAAAARARLQRAVDRRLFGARRDPYAVVSVASESAAAHAAPLDALAALVRAVQDSLRLPLVQVIDAQGEVVAQAGEAVVGTHVLPVIDRGRQLGVLVVGRRSRGERLRVEERSALEDVARRAGALLHANELTADLQRSYANTVRAREEERRRLRRDLHDGVGPTLAGLALQLDSLSAQLRDQPSLAARAHRMRDEVRTAVTEIRGIVDGLRPAAVDELGLAQALRLLETDDGDAIAVSVDVALPSELPAAIESAAYRIAGEAVANVLRHSGAQRASVTARVIGHAVELKVVDDGRGFGAEATAGVGLQSLHERAAEIGGTLAIRSGPGEGTEVVAVLPLSAR